MMEKVELPGHGRVSDILRELDCTAENMKVKTITDYEGCTEKTLDAIAEGNDIVICAPDYRYAGRPSCCGSEYYESFEEAAIKYKTKVLWINTCNKYVPDKLNSHVFVPRFSFPFPVDKDLDEISCFVSLGWTHLNCIALGYYEDIRHIRSKQDFYRVMQKQQIIDNHVGRKLGVSGYEALHQLMDDLNHFDRQIDND